MSVPAERELRAAWLLSRFPAVNHAFMLSEVERMETLGYRILPVSLADPDRPVQELSERERVAAARTWYVNRTGLSEVIAAQVSVLLRRPGGWLRGLWTALTFSRGERAHVPANVRYFLGAVVIGRRLEREGISRVHSHYSSTVAYLLSIVFADEPRIRYSMTIHGSGEFEDVRGFRLAEKAGRADLVIAISGFGRSQLMKITPPAEWSKIHTVHLGVDVPPSPARERRPGEPYRLVAAGTLAPVKGYPVLLEAVTSLRRDGCDVRLLLAGDGEDRAALERRAGELGLLPDGVEFLGWVRGDRLPEVYGRADLMVLSSFAEGIPVVLMEAMVMGIPCVATRITGIPELIEHGVSGLLVTPGDPDALAAAIRTVMESPGLAAELAANGKRAVQERFDLRTNTAALAELLTGAGGTARGLRR